MRNFLITCVLFLGGCSSDGIGPETRSNESKPYPDMLSKPTDENRRAIMSGGSPDWGSDRKKGVRVFSW